MRVQKELQGASGVTAEYILSLPKRTRIMIDLRAKGCSFDLISREVNRNKKQISLEIREAYTSAGVSCLNTFMYQYGQIVHRWYANKQWGHTEGLRASKARKPFNTDPTFLASYPALLMLIEGEQGTHVRAALPQSYDATHILRARLAIPNTAALMYEVGKYDS